MPNSAPILSLQPPAYYAPGISSGAAVRESLALRVFYATLPFMALHKPFGRAMTLVAHATRLISSLRENPQLLKIAVSVAAVAGTIFLHPVGLCATTLYDLFNGERFLSLETLQHVFYLGTMLMGSIEVIAISLLLSMAIEMVRSRKEFQEGHLIEATSHLLMSLVRGAQALPYIEKTAYQHDLRGKEFSRSLTETVAKVRDRAALFFYSSASFFVRPLWKSTSLWLETLSLHKNPQCSTSQKVLSTAKAAFLSCALLPLALSGLILGQISHFTAFNLSTTPYIHLHGGAAPTQPSDKPVSVFQLNCCLTAGGFALIFGGLEIPDEKRAEAIAAMIREQHPTLACLQEVSDLESALTLYRELHPEFAEFYLHMGATPFILQNNSGLFVASKLPITCPELHSFSDIAGTESMVNKCFFLFSTPAGNFITTHLSPSSNDLHPTATEAAARDEEQRRIFAAAEERFTENQKPVFVIGDFNTSQGPLFDRCSDRSPSALEAACETEALVARNWHHDRSATPQQTVLDYFLSFFRAPSASTTRVIKTFDLNHPEAAISDHPALVTTI